MENAGSILNIMWLAVCLAAFLWFLISTARRHRSSRRLLMCRALALGLALVSLFPCVSASDDSIRLTLLNSQFSGDAPAQLFGPDSHPGTEFLATLVGLLEILESAQVTVVLVLSVSLCLFALALGVSSGHNGQLGGRNSPTVYHAAGHLAQFWDGRAVDVEEQSKGPVLNPVEMAMTSEAEVVETLRSIALPSVRLFPILLSQSPSTT